MGGRGSCLLLTQDDKQQSRKAPTDLKGPQVSSFRRGISQEKDLGG